ncbi:MAG: serine/threonine-protein kinase [Myxococcota bacterium]|nr:serine/threonine-protein kinase [Myxococcota bacterium]
MTCHRCGYSPEGGEVSCPRDGSWLVATSEHAAHPRDGFLGTILGGKYAIRAVIGRGGFASVYRAAQLVGGKALRDVAIKVILPSLDKRSDAEARFRREAELIARLSHPNIVALHDFGVELDGTLYMALELIEGQTIATALLAGRFSYARIRSVVSQILVALDAAHAQGLIHRDLKPENVMLVPTRLGTDLVKVLDFGIAKLLQSSKEHQVTTDGQIFGTPRYMSREQFQGDELDARTDLYAVGVILCQLLTGTLIYEELTPHQIMHQVVTGSLPELPAAVPPAICSVVHKALRADRNERFATAGQMLAAVEAAFDDPQRPVDGVTMAMDREVQAVPPPAPHPSPPPGPGSSRSSRRRFLVPGLALGILAVGALSLLAVRFLTPEQPGQAATAPEVVRAQAETQAPAPPPSAPALTALAPVPLAAPVTAAAAVPEGVSPAATADRLARHRLDSVPPGAQVVDEAGKVLGSTPLELELEASPGSDRRYTLRARGFSPTQVHLPLDAGLHVRRSVLKQARVKPATPTEFQPKRRL